MIPHCLEWSSDQQPQHHLGVYSKCRISGPTPDLLLQNLYFNEISMGLHLSVEKYWQRIWPSFLTLGIKSSSPWLLKDNPHQSPHPHIFPLSFAPTISSPGFSVNQIPPILWSLAQNPPPPRSQARYPHEGVISPSSKSQCHRPCTFYLGL